MKKKEYACGGIASGLQIAPICTDDFLPKAIAEKFIQLSYIPVDSSEVEILVNVESILVRNTVNSHA